MAPAGRVTTMWYVMRWLLSLQMILYELKLANLSALAIVPVSFTSYMGGQN